MKVGLASIGLVAMWIAVLGTTFAADRPVARVTMDRNLDLLNALIEVNRFDDAVELCRWMSRGSDPVDDGAAKWAIGYSRVLSAMQLTKESFSDDEIHQAQSPVTTLLDSYPDHGRALFLQAQQRAVDRDAARHSVLRSAIAPNDEALSEVALRRLVTAASSIQSLAEKIAAEQSRLSPRRDPASTQQIADLVRLEQELQV